MGLCISACVQMLTRLHDERTLRKEQPQNDHAEFRQLAAAEKQPSVMLVFSIVERQNNENKIVSFLRKVFRRDASLVNQHNSDGETILYLACKQGKLKVIEYLLREFGKVVACEVCRWGSPIHGCVEGMLTGSLGEADGCRLMEDMLHYGCDINAVDMKQFTAFLLAASCDCVAALRCLARRGCLVTGRATDHMTALHLAAARGSVQSMYFLVGLGELDINDKDKHDRTPLLVALMAILQPNYFMLNDERNFSERVSVVELLLMVASDANAQHTDIRFRPTVGSQPTSLALCIHQVIREQLAMAQGLAIEEITFNTGPRTKFPIPVLSRLDTMSSMYSASVAMVIQVLLYSGQEGLQDVTSAEVQELCEKSEEVIENLGCGLTLQKRCRTAIRVYTGMGAQGIAGLKHLPLPNKLLRFLTFHQA